MHTATSPFPNSQTMPRDLRSGGPAEAGAGKTYPVDPEAVKRLKAHINGKAAPPAEQPQTAVPSVKRVGPAKAAAFPTKIDPTRYSPEVIAAAQTQEGVDGRRDIASVLTDEVLAIWSASGLSTKMIAKKAYNGLIEIAQSQASRYLRSYRERVESQAETAVSQPVQLAQAPTTPPAETAAITARAVPTLVDDEPETSTLVDTAPQPDPEPAAEESAVEEPVEPDTAVAPFVPEKPENLPAFLDRDYAPRRPGPGDALAALAALVNNEQLRVRGSVKLNLEIEFGE